MERLLAADPRGEVARLLHPQLEPAGEVRLGLGAARRPRRPRRGAWRARARIASSACSTRARIDAGRRPGARRRRRTRRCPSRRRRRARRSSTERRNRRLLMPSPRIALRTAERPGVGMVARQRRHADAELRLGRVAPAGQDPRPGRQRGRGLEAVASTPLPRPNAAPARPTASSCVDVAGDGDDGVRRPIRGRPEVADRRPRAGARTSASSPQISRPSGAVPEHRLLEQDLGVLGRVVEVAADLLDDDLALAVDLAVVERRPADQLAEDVHRPLGLAARHADPVDGRLAVRRRVERAADALDRLAEGPRRRVRAVPLNVRCSRKWAMPACSGASRREPARTYAAIDTDRAPASRARDHARPVGQRRPFEHRRDGTGAARPPRRDRTAGAEGAGRRAVAAVRCLLAAGTAWSQPCSEEHDEGDRDDPHQRVDLARPCPGRP